MSSIEQIVNTVDAYLEDTTTTTENMVNLILVEKWTHKDWSDIRFDDLTYEEREWLNYWAKTNRYQYKKIRDMANDMMQVFLGLTLPASLMILMEVF